MKVRPSLPFLSALTATVLLLHRISSIDASSSSSSSSSSVVSSATIDASGETAIVDVNDDDEASSSSSSSSSTCEPSSYLPIGDGNELSSCDVFRIATLKSSPRRCLHIEGAPNNPPDDADKDNDASIICIDHPNWFDGTNGCDAYSKNRSWCDDYGHLPFPQHSPHKAIEACCACGGGTRSKPRLAVGEYVKVKGYGSVDNCDELKIVGIRTVPKFRYVVEVTKPCGPKKAVRGANGGMVVEHSFRPGAQLGVSNDDPKSIDRLVRVELKRCRMGRKEQEFEFVHLSSGDYYNEGGRRRGSHMAVIRHKLTGVDLATDALDGKSPFLNITRVFDDDDEEETGGPLFDGSDDFFHVKVVSNTNVGRVNGDDGTPYGPTYSHLASGKFGEKEYSRAQTHSEAFDRSFNEQEFAMWRFQPVVVVPRNDESEGGDADEHAEWLARMARTMGTEYLARLSPWHLLDVERDAAKGDVKSRFRELGRTFHPDKLVGDRPSSEKRILFEGIFVLLQDAYQNLKGADESEKERFKVEAESGSHLFSHSQYVVELLPFHWTRLERDDDDESDGGGSGSGSDGGARYYLSAVSHLNATTTTFDGDDDASPPDDDEESEPTVQIWVVHMYSARCSMSRTVTGMVDLAARHLERHENVRVGAYGCGLYEQHGHYTPKDNDPLGLQSDPICSQFKRTETPNVHVIVETIPGRRRDEESGVMVEVMPDPELVRENAEFKYFYSAVPHGNTTQFYPHNIIGFARAGKRVWQDSHLVRRMTGEDFDRPHFAGNVSIVAYLDGTGNGETDPEVADAITSSLSGVARRFLGDDVYVGIARCGHGDDDFLDETDAGSAKRVVDCSKLDVAWLPDVKVYGVNSTEGVSLLRGNFGDTRDVQIALESMGNVLRMMLGGLDEDIDDEFEEMQDEENGDEGGGSCGNEQQPPLPPPGHDSDLDKIEGRTEDTPLIDMEPDAEEADELEPALGTESSTPALGQDDGRPKKPKLAGGSENPRLSNGREHAAARDRISGFHERKTKRGGGGKVLGGGSGGTAGFIA